MKQPRKISVLVARWQLRQLLLKFGALPVCFAWALFIAILQMNGPGGFIATNVTRPFLFKAREMLHRDPPLHPQLKILSYDDGSVDKLQRTDLTITDWATVLSAIAARKPRAIYIDKVFSIVNDPSNEKLPALAKLAATETPIMVGAFPVEVEKKTRAPLDLASDAYRVDALLAEAGEAPPDFQEYRRWHVYGPNPELQKIFHAAGHIIYWGNGLISPFLQPEAGVVVPHMTLMMERRSWMNGSLYINGIRTPLDSQGHFIINFSREDAYYDRHTRLGTAVLHARKGEPINEVDEGDTVLVLPEMYTGSTDFKQTPIGMVPAGFVLASMLNSVLSNNWLGEMPAPILQVFVFCLLGILLGNYRKSIAFWLTLVGISVAILTIGVYLFSFQNIEAPIPFNAVAFWGTSLIIFADRNLKREKEARRVADELNDAAEIAKAFRPEDAPVWELCDIATYHRSFSEASGDWYAFCRGPAGKLHHFVICDVTGHGVQAALMVSICKTVLALYTRDRKEALDDPHFLEVFARELNSMLFHHGRGRHLLTMLGITFDSEKGEAHYMPAGHPPPIISKDNGKGGRAIRQLALRSSILGLFDSFKPKLHTQKIANGEEIIAYTDGLPVGHQVRALQQFMNAPRADFGTAPEDLLAHIWAAETKKTGKTLDDDVSIVWFRITGLSQARPDAGNLEDVAEPLRREVGT